MTTFFFLITMDNLEDNLTLKCQHIKEHLSIITSISFVYLTSVEGQETY